MEREKGAVSATCGNCGGEVELQAQPDGSVAAQPCPTCYGQPAEASQLREVPSAAYDSDSGQVVVQDDGEERDNEA